MNSRWCRLITLADITRQLLKSGADITQINCIRKRLSAVKGGRFAALCAPAKVLTVALSDVLGDDPAAIASGPAVPDSSTGAEALEIVHRYGLQLDGRTLALLSQETPKALSNVETVVAGGVRQLCAAAVAACESLGYENPLPDRYPQLPRAQGGRVDGRDCPAAPGYGMLPGVRRRRGNRSKRDGKRPGRAQPGGLRWPPPPRLTG